MKCNLSFLKFFVGKSCFFFQKIPKSRDCPWDSSAKQSQEFWLSQIRPMGHKSHSWDWDENRWDSPGIVSFGTQVSGTKILGTGSPVPCSSLISRLEPQSRITITVDRFARVLFFAPVNNSKK